MGRMGSPRARSGATTVNASSGASGMALGEGLYSLLEIGGAALCSVQQLVTTHDCVFGLLQNGVMIPSKMSAQDLQIFLAGTGGKFNGIAWTVAIITQIIYWGAMLPGTPMHNRFLHNLVTWGFFGLEVTTDMWYSIATNTTLGGAISYIFSFGNGGWLVSLCYIAAMSAGSMLLGWRGLHRLGRVAALVFQPRATTI